MLRRAGRATTLFATFIAYGVLCVAASWGKGEGLVGSVLGAASDVALATRKNIGSKLHFKEQEDTVCTGRGSLKWHIIFVECSSWCPSCAMALAYEACFAGSVERARYLFATYTHSAFGPSQLGPFWEHDISLALFLILDWCSDQMQGSISNQSSVKGEGMVLLWSSWLYLCPFHISNKLKKTSRTIYLGTNFQNLELQGACSLQMSGDRADGALGDSEMECTRGLGLEFRPLDPTHQLGSGWRS